MKTGQELIESQDNLRKEAEITFLSLREKVKELYVKETGSEECPVGTITLPRSYIYQYVNEQYNDIINGVKTDENCVNLHSENKDLNFYLHEVKLSTIIAIIMDFEDMIKHPESIDII